MGAVEGEVTVSMIGVPDIVPWCLLADNNGYKAGENIPVCDPCKKGSWVLRERVEVQTVEYQRHQVNNERRYQDVHAGL